MNNNPSDLLTRLASLKRWSRGGERAPHKPLLLLLAIGRIQRGEDRLVKFEDIELPLKNLLMEYGPSRASYHAEFPFWHLRSDGLWEIPGEDLLTPKKGGSSPTVGTLRENTAIGGLPLDYYSMLASDPALLHQAVRTILETHFPASLYDELLGAVGIDDSASSTSALLRSTERLFFNFEGEALRGPRKGQPAVNADYSHWHRDNCFMG